MKAALALAGVCVLAMVQARPPAFRSGTDLVAMNVTVVDDQGNSVTGLGQASFAIIEDGKPRPIVQFAAGAVPLSLIVAVDASSSMQGRRFQFARQAVLRLLDRLSSDDEFYVFGFGERVFNITKGTKRRDEVERTLADVHPHGPTAFYDAVAAGVQALRAAEHQRKALVVITDGNDHMIDPYKDDRRPVAAREAAAIEIVRQSETLVYTIGVDSPRGSVERLNGDALKRLTLPTGGTTRIVSSDEGITTAAEQVGDELHQQYMLGFTPAHPFDGKFHKVRITVPGCPTCVARTRAGFIADK